jgi:hypothetical protein
MDRSSIEKEKTKMTNFRNEAGGRGREEEQKEVWRPAECNNSSRYSRPGGIGSNSRQTRTILLMACINDFEKHACIVAKL